MNLENIMINEIQTQKDKHGMIYFHEVPQIGKFMETGSRIMVTMGWGQGYNGDFLFNEYGDSIWADEKVLKRIVVMVAQL